MRRERILRHSVAALRGMLVILTLVTVFVLAQLVPDFLSNGFTGVSTHVERVAKAGVPPEHWPAAVSRIYESLAVLGLALLIMYLAQLWLGRLLHDLQKEWP